MENYNNSGSGTTLDHQNDELQKDRQLASALIDNILRIAVTGGLVATALLAPNAVQLFDKPVQRYLKQLDDKARKREIGRYLAYMKRKKLIADDYKHGLQITTAGRKRLSDAEFDNLRLQAPEQWDGKWHMVFYDIPEARKRARNSLNVKLRQMGFYQLQRSVWLSPFPCRTEVEHVALKYDAQKYLTYIECSYIDNQQELLSRFSKSYSSCNFSVL